MSMKISRIVLAVVLNLATASLLPAQTTLTVEQATEAKLTPRMRTLVHKPLPADADGLVVARAQLGAVRNVPFCDQGEKQCGLSPECDHTGKTLATMATFKLTGTLINRSKVPELKGMDSYRNPPDMKGLALGDLVWMAYYSLKSNQPPRIAMMDKIVWPPPPAAPAPPSVPATTPQ